MDKIHSLRFITTYKCNFNCTFCHKEGILNSTNEELSPDKFNMVLKVLLNKGFEKLKFVGGEPLICKNLENYIDIAFNLKVKNIGISTNGVFTKKICKIAHKYPNTHFTISIPTLNAKEYRFITRYAKPGNALKTLRQLKSIEANSTINMVIYDLSQINNELLHTIGKLFKLTSRIKLIAPCTSNYNRLHDSQLQILYKLLDFLDINGIKKKKRYLNHIFFDYTPDSELLVTTPYCPIFCRELQKLAPSLRLTPEGFIKPCFIYNEKNILLSFDKPSSVDNTINYILHRLMKEAGKCVGLIRNTDYQALLATIGG